MQLNIEISVEDLVAQMDRHYLNRLIDQAQAKLAEMDAKLAAVPLYKDEKRCIERNQYVIDVIKAIRFRTNLGLGDAKRVVDLYRAGLPAKDNPKTYKLANCGCVHHAEDGIPCPHDIALNALVEGAKTWEE